MGALTACAWSLLSCEKLDRVLEGPAPLDARLSVAVESEAITIAAGSDVSTMLTLSRIGDFSGPVTLTTERVPDGLTAVIENEQTTGQTTTATLRLRADSTARVGTFGLGLRGHAERVRDATLQMSISVVPPLAYALSVSAPSITIARGGIARVALALVRTNYTGPVALALEGAPGITAIFDESPLRGASTPFTIAVASSVSAGSHVVTVRGAVAGIADRVSSFTVNVTNDPLQILIGAPISASQASVGTTSIIINRGAQVGVVALSAENLPSGVVATIQPEAPSGASTIVLTIAPSAVPGTSPITVRARASGVPDATAELLLTVTEARIDLSPASLSVDVFQGSSIRSTVRIVRSSYSGEVAFTFDELPSGLFVSALPTHTTGDSVVLNVSASPAISAGTYPVTLRAVPGGLASAATVVASLRVIVRAASGANGNVLLDWSGCDPPQWVAGQDGTGPWQTLPSVAGTFRFSITTGKGGFAFVTALEPLAVRYHTQAELADRPIDMCPPNVATKVVRGRGEHSLAGQTWIYALGGGSASSTTLAPDFSISNVRYGPQDFFGWAPLGTGYRGIIRRSVDIPDGLSLSEGVNLAGPEAFVAARDAFSIVGAIGAGESLRHTMAYLTGSSCISNGLYTSAAHGIAPTVFGVPLQFQGPDDFHFLTVIVAGASGFRTGSVSFRAFHTRIVSLAPELNTPVLVQLAAPYKRLQVSLGVLPAVFNGSVDFRYTDGTHSMSVIASSGYLGSGPVTLAIPDVSAIAAFSSPLIISPATGVSWSITLDGASTPSPCTEARTGVQLRRLGVF